MPEVCLKHGHEMPGSFPCPECDPAEAAKALTYWVNEAERLKRRLDRIEAQPKAAEPAPNFCQAQIIGFCNSTREDQPGCRFYGQHNFLPHVKCCQFYGEESGGCYNVLAVEAAWEAGQRDPHGFNRERW